MVVWVVKIFDYDTGNTDVWGVYSNLALAGRAVASILDYALDDGRIETYVRFEESWGYFFQVYAIGSQGKTQVSEIEIGRVIVNE